MKRWLAWRRNIKPYQDFMTRLSKLRLEADQLGLIDTHNKIAEAMRDAPFEIRRRPWISPGNAAPQESMRL